MLGEALRLIRVFNDYKTADLAKELDVSPSYISEIENNHKTPSMDVLKKYAQHFGLSVSSIMFFAEDIDKDKKRPARAAIRNKLVKFLQMVEHAAT